MATYEAAVDAVLDELTGDAVKWMEELALLSGPAPGEETDSGTPASLVDDLVCAICLDTVEPADIAIIKGCDHLYCATCILKWSLIKEDAVTCPKCKLPFNYLYTYRALDGTLSDFPQEESVCLLRRAAWFEDALGSFKGKMLAQPDSDPELDGFYEEQYSDEDDGYDDHALYMSSSGRRGRVTLGNRRWGSNGYVQSGRMAARPVQAPRPSKAELRVARKEQDLACEPGRNRRAARSTSRSGKAPIVGSPSGSSALSGTSPPSGGGRRARRAAKRAEQDRAA